MNRSILLRKQKMADKVSSDEESSVACRLISDEYFDGDESTGQVTGSCGKVA